MRLMGTKKESTERKGLVGVIIDALLDNKIPSAFSRDAIAEYNKRKPVTLFNYLKELRELEDGVYYIKNGRVYVSYIFSDNWFKSWPVDNEKRINGGDIVIIKNGKYTEVTL